jgi:Ser/Thr protein kinase RdoA (MazF antagonist)
MDHIYLAGQFAAMIHAASDDFVSSHSRFRLDLDYLIENPLARLRPFLADRPDERAYLEEFASRLRARAETAVSAGLDWGVCHGDYQASNIMFTEDQRLTVLDFDYCGPGWRAFDFAFIQWFAMSPDKAPIWDCFLKGYTETRRLDGADLAAVPIFHAMSHLWALGAYAGNANRWGIQFVTGGYFDSELAFFRRWEADHLE